MANGKMIEMFLAAAVFRIVITTIACLITFGIVYMIASRIFA